MPKPNRARLIKVLGWMGLAQVAQLAQPAACGQATLDGAQPQFGTQPAPYEQRADDRAQQAARAVPVLPGGYAGYGGYAPQVGGEAGSLGAPDPSHPLGRGDTVTFSIVQDREPAQVMQVTDSGELDFSAFPKIGRISVAGRTCSQIAGELKRKLEADYYKQADVVLGINRVNVLSSKGRVYLSGNVRAPGPQELPANERTKVSTAIIRAGGPDKFADLRHVQVTRKVRSGAAERYVVDVNAIINKGRLEKDIEVQDGDYINVPQRIINF